MSSINQTVGAVATYVPAVTEKKVTNNTSQAESVTAKPANAVQLSDNKGMEAQQLSEALDVINRAVAESRKSLNFSTDEISGRSVIKVVDSTTDEVIRQIPTEEILKVAQDVKRLQDEMGKSIGLLIDNRV